LVRRPQQLARREDSYRTARHLFEADGAPSGQFYALEMDTLSDRRDVSIVEQWLLFLFALSSGCARHIRRAIVVLLTAIGVVTLLLWFAFD
jgi:hypothetical protein